MKIEIRKSSQEPKPEYPLFKQWKGVGSGAMVACFIDKNHGMRFGTDIEFDGEVIELIPHTNHDWIPFSGTITINTN